jgi:hypothetical protein
MSTYHPPAEAGAVELDSTKPDREILAPVS